jgi:hypothetical protein
LRHMMGNIDNHDARQASHEEKISDTTQVPTKELCG